MRSEICGDEKTIGRDGKAAGTGKTEGTLRTKIKPIQTKLKPILNFSFSLFFI